MMEIFQIIVLTIYAIIFVGLTVFFLSIHIWMIYGPLERVRPQFSELRSRPPDNKYAFKVIGAVPVGVRRDLKGRIFKTEPSDPDRPVYLAIEYKCYRVFRSVVSPDDAGPLIDQVDLGSTIIITDGSYYSFVRFILEAYGPRTEIEFTYASTVPAIYREDIVEYFIGERAACN